jgi:hypothetical protein
MSAGFSFSKSAGVLYVLSRNAAKSVRDESFPGIRLALHVDVVPILVSGCKEESGEASHCIVGMQSTGAALSKPLGEITVASSCRKLRRDEFEGSSLGRARCPFHC